MYWRFQDPPLAGVMPLQVLEELPVVQDWYEGTNQVAENWELRNAWLSMTVHSSVRREPTK